jgi:hypothetical protein
MMSSERDYLDLCVGSVCHCSRRESRSCSHSVRTSPTGCIPRCGRSSSCPSALRRGGLYRLGRAVVVAVVTVVAFVCIIVVVVVVVVVVVIVVVVLRLWQDERIKLEDCVTPSGRALAYDVREMNRKAHSKKFVRLNEAIGDMLDEYSLVSFIPIS